MIAKKRVEVSRLRGVESVISHCGKFEINALDDRSCTAVNGTSCHSYGVSLGIWDHTSEHTPF